MLLYIFQDFLKHALLYLFLSCCWNVKKYSEVGTYLENKLTSVNTENNRFSVQYGRILHHDIHAHVILLSFTTFNAFRTFHWNHLLGITEIAKNKTKLRSQRRAYTLRLLVFFGLSSTSTNTKKNKEENQDNQNEYRRHAQSNHHAV